MKSLFRVFLSLWLFASPSWAAGVPLILQDGQGGAGSSILQVSYVATDFSGGSRVGAVATYTGLNIGPTAGYTTRRVIFVISTNNLLGPSAISSVLINGSITPTIHTQVSQGGSGTPFAAVFSADIPTGTSATVAITYNASIFNGPALATYGADDALMLSTTPTVPTPGTSASGTTVSTGSYGITNGGFIIAAAGTGSATSSSSFSGGVVKDQSTAGQFAGHANSVGPTGSTTTTASWTNSSTSALVAATWR